MRFFLLLFSLCWLDLFGQSISPHLFLDSIFKLKDSAVATHFDRIKGVCEEKGSPLILGDSVLFIYLGKAEKVQIAGDFNSWDPSGSDFSQLSDSTVWYLATSFPSDARLEYKLVLNTKDWMLDPMGSTVSEGGYGLNSLLVMTGYQHPQETQPDKDLPKGSLETFPVRSGSIGEVYSVSVCLPAEYSLMADRKLPVVYFHDGPDYITHGKALVVLDNLIGRQQIQPLIGVFIKPNDRIEEFALGKREAYMNFIVTQLVPLIDSLYRTIPDADGRAVIGCSLGGKISAYLSLDHPDVFGHCGMHSPALWLNENEGFDKMMGSSLVPVSWYSIWGSFESLHEQCLAVSDHLRKIGSNYREKVFPEGHNWGLWSATLDDFLLRFFPYER